MTSSTVKVIIVSHVIILGSIAYSGSLQDMECKYLLNEMDKCWERYTSLPVCENAYDPLVECAARQVDAAQRKECSPEVKTDLQMFWKIYTIMKEALCSDDYLYNEFKTKLSCWSMVRDCSAVVSFSLNREKDEECTSYLENMQICYYKSQRCSDVLHRYAAALATGTPCSETMEVEFLTIKINFAVKQTFQIFTLLLTMLLVFYMTF